MSAPNKEQFKNEAVTTVAEDVDGSETVITVTDGSVFPSSGNFRVRIDDEIMICTSRSTNDLTVVRGQESTSATTHSNGTAISLVLTADAFARANLDYNPLYGYNLALGRLVDDDGITVLTASSFTDVNAGGSDSKTDQNGTVLLRKAAQAGPSLFGLMRTAPATPYHYIAAFQAVCPLGAASGDRPNFGMLFRESSTGKVTTYEIESEAGTGQEPISWRVTNRASATTITGGAARARLMLVAVPVIWIKAEDDGTNLKYHIGMDGINWTQLFSQGRTAHMAGGPNQVGWYVDNDVNDKEILVRLCHWSRG